MPGVFREPFSWEAGWLAKNQLVKKPPRRVLSLESRRRSAHRVQHFNRNVIQLQPGGLD
jgi:hypothetical protein